MTTPKTPVHILDMTPAYTYDRTTVYRFAHSLPWITTTPLVRATPEDAYADAEAWAAKYRAADSYGNMAHALGVARRADGYVGVVNYYHSNT